VHTGAIALAAVLYQGLCSSLLCLDLSGCEVADDGAASLGQAISGSTAGGDSTTCSSGQRQGWGVKHLPATTGSGNVNKSQLEELMLADNHITAAGEVLVSLALGAA